jgi:hypothetical protein
MAKVTAAQKQPQGSSSRIKATAVLEASKLKQPQRLKQHRR